MKTIMLKLLLFLMVDLPYKTALNILQEKSIPLSFMKRGKDEIFIISQNISLSMQIS